MKISKPLYIIVLLLVMLFSYSFYQGKDLLVMDNVFQDTSAVYKDGIYEGSSRSKYVGEPFWGKVRINIKNGVFTKINFTIRDSDLHESFNEKYEKHFLGDSLYTQQCRNDWRGVKKYPKKLRKVQNIDKIDVISGATWSYNIFKASVKKALINAVNRTDTLTTR
jgi:major membrane immunogen (membrane-anchored lipoprotein)